MGTGIDLFLDWENGIWVAGTGIWPLGMGNEVLKNGNGIEVMRVDSQYTFDPFLMSLVMIFVVNYNIPSTTCKQAYSGARNSGFSDYVCPQVRSTAEYMPGFRYILHLTLSIYLKGKVQQKIPSCQTLKGLKTVYSTDKGRTIIFLEGGWTFCQRKGVVVVANNFFAPASFCKQFVFVHRMCLNNMWCCCQKYI
jgi:hypothetical protein